MLLMIPLMALMLLIRCCIQELVLALAQMEEHVFGPQQPALTPHRRPVPPIEPLGMGRSPLVDRFSKMFEPTARQPVQPRTAHSSHAREARTSRSHHIDEAQGERDWSSTVDVLKNNEKQKALTQRQEAQARHRSAKSHRRHLKASLPAWEGDHCMHPAAWGNRNPNHFSVYASAVYAGCE